MSKPKHISEILQDYFQNSDEPLAVAYREYIANSGSCPLCPNSPIEQKQLSDWLEILKILTNNDTTNNTRD